MLQCGIFEHEFAKLGHKLATLEHQFDRYRPFIPQKGETLLVLIHNLSHNSSPLGVGGLH